MFIKHFTKSKPNHPNVIRLQDVTYATEHTEHNEAIQHVGFKVKALAADKEGHRYEIVFETDQEYQDLLQRAVKLQHRFPEGRLPPINGENDEELEENDGGDEGA